MKEEKTAVLDPLSVRQAPLDLDGESFRRIGHRLVDQIADFLEAMPNGAVTPAESPETVRALIETGRGIPENGADPAALLSETAHLLFAHSLFNGHHRFLGY